MTVEDWGYQKYKEVGPSGYGPDLSSFDPDNVIDYYGRNYVVEMKGVTEDLTFDGNTAKYNSGGIQFWDENDTSNFFTDTVISNNVFTDFFNADPDGVLSQVESRHESSLVGGVVFSVVSVVKQAI